MKGTRTKATAIKTKTVQKVMERDRGSCIFCDAGYEPDGPGADFGKSIMDIMHFIPRSQGGKGIEQNLAVGCRYHHQMLDNGKDGRRGEMLEIFEKHLRFWHKGWNKEDLIYKKGEP